MKAVTPDMSERFAASWDHVELVLRHEHLRVGEGARLIRLIADMRAAGFDSKAPRAPDAARAAGAGALGVAGAGSDGSRDRVRLPERSHRFTGRHPRDIPPARGGRRDAHPAPCPGADAARGKLHGCLARDLFKRRSAVELLIGCRHEHHRAHGQRPRAHRRRRSGDAAALRAQRRPRAPRPEVRLRPRPVRRVHGHRRRPRDSLVRDAGQRR